VIRTAFRSKSAAGAIFLVLGVALISTAAPTDKTPPVELVKYIQDSQQRGLPSAKIRSQAIAVGWPAATVDEALVYLRSTKAPAATIEVTKSANAPAPPEAPAMASSAPNPKQPGTLPDPTFARGVPDDYVIGSGDSLQINVWKEPEASVPTVVVRPDGKITVPLIKEVEVAGSTPTQAEQKITERLAKFISDANVTVVVATISSKKIYIIGAARKEGPLPYTYGMSVMQALSEAGGITEYAKRKKIYILRTEAGREYRLDFNYDDVVKGQSMEQNILLLPGDTVVVPH